MECNNIAQTNEPIISIIISILALIISIIAIITEKHVSRSQLRIDFFNDHFKEALSKKIPCARNKIIFHEERIHGCEELQNALAEMRRDAVYFKYANPKFYKKFEEVNQDTEDYFIDALNKNYSENRQQEFLKNGDKKLQELYTIINRKYFG